MVAIYVPVMTTERDFSDDDDAGGVFITQRIDISMHTQSEKDLAFI